MTDKVELDNYGAMRYRLVSNIAWTIVVMLTFVVLINFRNTTYVIPHISAIAGCLVAIFYLRRTKKYQLVGKYVAVIGVILLGLTAFFLKNHIQYTTPMWMITHTCVVFAVVGYRWGSFVLLVHFCVLSIYILMFMKYNLEHLPVFTNPKSLSYVVEFCVCGFGIGYTLYTSFKFLSVAQSNMEQQNEALQTQFDLISKQNNEKEILMKEVHHRVKNNLQLISSLLSIQKRSLGVNEVSFEDSIARVKAIALIHEKFYSSEAKSEFCLKDYLSSSLDLLVSNYSDEEVKVNFIFRGDGVNLSQDSITSIALLFNELIIGSIRRRKSVEELEIVVGIKLTENNEYEIMYNDNAEWLLEKLNPTGSIIVDSMIEQLDGTIMQREVTKEGFRGKAVFPLPKERFSLEK